MRKQIMQQITENLHNMETTGKVDLNILQDLNELRNLLQQLKNKWLDNRSTDSYYFYQGLRNIELMLNKMQERFEHAPEKNDNPKIAEDSQILFRVVDDLLAITESDNITTEMINKVLRKTRDLRDTASKQNLIEPVEVDEESVDKENIRYNLNEMMKNLDIPREEDLEIVSDGEPEDNS